MQWWHQFLADLAEKHSKFGLIQSIFPRPSYFFVIHGKEKNILYVVISSIVSEMDQLNMLSLSL